MNLKTLENIYIKKSKETPWSVLSASSLLSFLIICSITYFAINVFHTLHSEIDGLKSDEFDTMTMLSDTSSSYTQLRIDYLKYFHLTEAEKQIVRSRDAALVASLKSNWEIFLKTQIDPEEKA